jgi:phytoene desaturase
MVDRMREPRGLSGLAGEDVVVVGGGFGGLATAAYAARAGADVEVVEKNDQVGGRASRLVQDGFSFDMGPSWYLMPDVFETFFEHMGTSPEERFELTQLDPHYRIFFKDGDRVEITPDLAETKRTFESYEEGAGEALDAYLATARESYETGMKAFVYEDRRRLRDFLSLDVARQAWGLPMFGSLADHVADHFEHPKLQKIMEYTLVFLGGDPEWTPALYNLMSHVDHNMGVWYPEGGMATVANAVAEVAREQGATLTTGTPVTGIDRSGAGPRVRTAEGDREPDRVVANADYAHVEQDLLSKDHRQHGADYWEGRTWAPSAFLLYLGVEGSIDPLAHHSLVLPTDWRGHFDALFEEAAWPEDPAYYVCAPSQTDDGVAPAGASNLFVLVPVAAGLRDGPKLRQRFRDRVLADLADHTGVDVRDRIVTERVFAVDDFTSRYNAYNGTALGLAHTLDQTATLRPDRVSGAMEDLFFVGQYTTPGIGVPMCLISGLLTAEAMAER